ncbi:cytochrome P450 4C1-like [Cydia pomonella]|uniref:cytochrome P450 4C1-like n=1 Tax=Cydia pomonella TaxID=82600 RepID=UPI002ADD7522|nr:cytochrome P450 4C1-like [Cydia pomonella]
MLWLLVVLALTLAALQYRWRRRALYRLHAALAADLPGHPLVGHATLLIGTDEDRMKAFQLIGRAALRQGGLASAWMLNRLYVVVADAVVAGVVARRCLDKDEATMGFIRTLIGNGSIFAPVEIWRPRRKILAPVFGVRRVAAFVGVFDRHAAAAADQLRALAGAGDFSLWDPLSAYTFDAVCETSLGVRLRSQGGAPHPFLRAFAGAQRELARRMCAPWLYPGALYRLLPPHRRFARCRRLIHSFIDEVIRDKRKTMSSLENKESASADADTDSGPASFLELMLQGGEYSERELREEVMVLVMAGSDTTALGAAFTLLLLARHPAVQDRLRRECDVLVMAGSDTTAHGAAFTLLLLARHPAVQDRLRDVLVMAGSDTTALGAAFTLLLLARHPAVQDRLRREPAPTPPPSAPPSRYCCWRATRPCRTGCAESNYILYCILLGDVLVMAGSDTTALGAAFTLLLLARHPAVQDRLRRELTEVLGRGDALSAAALARLRYLDAVVREALRLYPPVPVTVREVHEDVELPGGLVLPAGVAVLLNTWATHRSAAYWGADADCFRPERFLQAPPRHPAQFMPFGYSTRNCLGSQYAMLAMKTVLAHTLLHLRVLPPADAGDAPADEADAPLRVKFDIAMKHVDNYMVRVELVD